MTIIRDAPEPRPSLVKDDLELFAARLAGRTIICEIASKDADGNVIERRRFTFTDETTPSFADFVANVASARTFRRETEQYLSTLDPKLAGTVD